MERADPPSNDPAGMRALTSRWCNEWTAPRPGWPGLLDFFELEHHYECEECVCPVDDKDDQVSERPVLAAVKPRWSGVGWVVGNESRLRTGDKGWSREESLTSSTPIGQQAWMPV